MAGKRPLRILHTNMLRGWGGQSNRILTEARGTAAAGHAVAFAVPHVSGLYRKAEEAGLEVFPNYEFRPPLQVWRFVPDLNRLLSDIRRWKPDIIHLHGSQDSWLVMTARRVARFRFPITIRTRHNVIPWQVHRANRWLYEGIDAYISISGASDQMIVDYPGLKAKPRRLIHSVPDIPRFTDSTASIREQLGPIPPGAFLWGMSARLREEKAHDVLLKGFAKLRTTHPNSYLVLAGDGSERGALEAQARLLGLGPECLTFLGFRKDMPNVLASLDGYVHPARQEGLGTAILEALSVGLPTVGTNVGGIPDSVRHEQTGLLVEPENPDQLAAAMARIMDDPALRPRLRENAMRMIRDEFTEAHLIGQTVDFYQEVLRTFGRV